MKTKILKLLPLSVAALLLLACNGGGSSSSSAASSASSSTPTSSSASTPSSSSEAPVSSSSSEAPVSSSSSSEEEKAVLVEAIAPTDFEAGKNINIASAGGHFVGTKVTVDSSSIATAGTSSTSSRVIKVVADAPGYLEFENLRTGSGDDVRTLYLAQADSSDASTISAYISRQICDVYAEGNTEGKEVGDPINYDCSFSVPAAGTYYLMSNASVKFASLSLYSYSVNANVVDGVDETMPTGVLFDAHYAAPTAVDYTEAHAFGSSLTANVGASIRFHGKITNDTDSAVTYYNSLYLEATDSFTYTAAGAGTLTVTAIGRNSDETTVTTLTGADSAGTAITTDTTTPFNVKSDSVKTAISQQFSLNAAGSYTFTADGVLAIFEISWSALE